MNYRDYMKVRDVVWEVLIQERIDTLPISGSKLCRTMGISVREYPGEGSSDGKSMLVDGMPVIFVSRQVPIPRQRFTLAHELGHVLLGHVGKYRLVNREPSKTDTPIEREANVFASRLLAPACVLWGCNVRSAEQIASLCHISQTAAEYRWERVQLLYERNKFLTSLKERNVYEQFQPFIQSHRL